MTHPHRWVEKRAGLNIVYVQCRDCGAQSDELPFSGEGFDPHHVSRSGVQSVNEESA